MNNDSYISQVAKDAIFKAMIKQENKARENFQENYGYMLGPLIDIIKDEIPTLIDRPSPNTENALSPQSEIEEPRLNLKVLPSPTPFPRTTSAMIGWRSGCEYWLDRKCTNTGY
ncbi:unnamed protein product [Hymenolepis diminuta]|uniref:Uncharacterized protein n=1 Tax=Hymenolepis diminuta TaxID=6216 RepID=A0A564Z5D7_HYMDI|nr:unnamed protein product [Hymenolepis diminuta]